MQNDSYASGPFLHCNRTDYYFISIDGGQPEAETSILIPLKVLL
jgi:hypothetical protein